MVLYRERPCLRPARLDPRATGGPQPFEYDLVLAAQPYRSRTSAETKVKNVLAPLAKALAPAGRLVVVQSTGHDPGMEVDPAHLAGRGSVRDAAPQVDQGARHAS